ncbi:MULTISPECIES: hypothetical protein [unclassified Roseofilum]|uniref:hypothetical protein n=1 Tax=unclassified Roseofilum TaxID=2620099 RepID=UPI001B1C9A3C|nr:MULTISPECIES: hypothetical protein [unclassified Roseofilum]MBP0007578.1 hypothetical protein [Roseofilum sp. Belize Diploria]MBP0033940.1 hypothetical protein [Roseofilum sp. Belize BBD 4]
MSDTHFKQAWSLVNEYFHSHQIDPSKYVDHELVRIYLKACQKSTPKGVSISKQGNRLYLRFKTATKTATADNSCNEDFTRDGCINALAKALAVFDKLKGTDKESEFWSWYETQIKGNTSLENDIITIGDAIEVVKKQFFKDYDKVGRDRSDSSLDTNSKASYQEAYGVFHSKLNPELKLTADNLISEVERIWGHLGQSSGFRSAKSAVCKLLRIYRLSPEVDKFNAYFGRVQIKKRRERQTVSIETFLDFRARVLGLDGYELTTAQQNNLESRKSWFKAICINMIYGFRCSEFKAIANLDKPYKCSDGEIIPAIHDPSNKDFVIVLKPFFWVVDDAGNKHKITIKMGGGFVRPMIHPNYPRLIKELGINNPDISLPVVTPKSTSKKLTIKGCYQRGMRRSLTEYIDQVGEGFTQTHALRHLANYHGKLAGLTRDQRSMSLRHSQSSNDSYDEHLTPKAQLNLLTADVSQSSEIQQLKEKLAQRDETIKSLEETILFLKKENARLNELLGGNDDLPRIGN